MMYHFSVTKKAHTYALLYVAHITERYTSFDAVECRNERLVNMAFRATRTISPKPRSLHILAYFWRRATCGEADDLPE